MNYLFGKQMKKLICVFAVLILFVLGCEYEQNHPSVSEEYRKKINEWHSKRISNLKKDSGWLNLVGLYWLEEGENTFGTDNSNNIVFPENSAVDFIGKIIKQDSIITVEVNEGVNVYFDNRPVNTLKMKADVSGDPTILRHNTLRWFILQRGEKFGIRLRDLEAELVKNFDGIERFPLSDEWKISAKFEKYTTPKKILIPTILGTIEEDYSPGKIIFNLEGKEYSLEPTASGEKLFIVFADLTSGEETYGAGRFLYIDGPDSSNMVKLDFNKAYNPPCAFTKYATCPLPPEENKLRIRITAGEKNYGEFH